MQVQAYMYHMIVATSHIVSFKKLKFIYAGVGDNGLIGFIIM